LKEYIPAFSCLHPVAAAVAARPPFVHWRGSLYISKRAEMDTVATDIEFEMASKNIYWEKQVLIDALDTWTENLKGAPCGNLNCPEYP
jgi:hypothetical protein